MPKVPRIAIVEDELIVANHIKKVIKEFGYTCVGMASTSDEAIRLASEETPDLMLMDIRLKGDVNGITVAQHIRDYYDIPVVYLTAFADDKTLAQAKLTEPFGFVIKPFGNRELFSAIELGLYRHKMESQLRRSERNLQDALKSLQDAVISTDNWGYVTFMNAEAERLTGWPQKQALGRDISEVFITKSGLSYEDVMMLVSGKNRNKGVDPLIREKISRMVQQLTKPALLISRNGVETLIENKSAAAIRDDAGNVTGAVIAFRSCDEMDE